MRSLTPPLTDSATTSLQLGEQVCVDGTVYILRDATHQRIFDEKVPPPPSLEGAMVLHGAPSFEKQGDRYTIVSVGPTTSMRVEKYTPSLIERYGVRGIIGKGGMGPATAEAMHQHHAVYLALVGGSSALITSQIESVEDVWWPDLYGEALWKIRVKDLGPAVVAIDCHGNNLFENVQRRALDEVDRLVTEKPRDVSRPTE
jgi:tartrate/fumarate subfamily iron-sulfur-dependent hydro-lyase beta chain